MPILSPNKLYKDFDLSFAAHPQTRDVLKKVDANSIKQSLKTLLFTNLGERLFQPNVGSPLYNLLFEPADAITTLAIKRSIENTISQYEPRIALELVDVFPNEDENSYEISIYFTPIGINQPTSLTVTLERLR
jgi:phage baseplate assembly protein W